MPSASLPACQPAVTNWGTVVGGERGNRERACQQEQLQNRRQAESFRGDKLPLQTSAGAAVTVQSCSFVERDVIFCVCVF